MTADDPLAAAWDAAVAAHEAQLTVGQCVRVRLSGECQFWAHCAGEDRGYEDGAIARVSRLVPPECNAGHGYEVQFEKPWPRPPGKEWPKLIGSVFAACELVPLDADVAGEEGGDRVRTVRELLECGQANAAAYDLRFARIRKLQADLDLAYTRARLAWWTPGQSELGAPSRDYYTVKPWMVDRLI